MSPVGKRPDGERIWTIVLAAGSGQRFGAMKQFETIGSRRLVDWSVDAARATSDGVVLVVPADMLDRESAGLDAVVAGGATRSESVRRGLAAVPAEATIICVHDAARPFATFEDYRRVIDAVHGGADGAVPGLTPPDTIKLVEDDGVVVSTLPRSALRAVATPQAFRAAALRAAHTSAGEGTDDASLVEANGGRVVVVEGSAMNRKITTPEDMAWARAMQAREI
jgi:2-C-methyl-D-erythritol 4-phosphate cytidylyltransferase